MTMTTIPSIRPSSSTRTTSFDLRSPAVTEGDGDRCRWGRADRGLKRRHHRLRQRHQRPQRLAYCGRPQTGSEQPLQSPTPRTTLDPSKSVGAKPYSPTKDTYSVLIAMGHSPIQLLAHHVRFCAQLSGSPAPSRLR